MSNENWEWSCSNCQLSGLASLSASLDLCLMCHKDGHNRKYRVITNPDLGTLLRPLLLVLAPRMWHSEWFSGLWFNFPLRLEQYCGWPIKNNLIASCINFILTPGLRGFVINLIAPSFCISQGISRVFHNFSNPIYLLIIIALARWKQPRNRRAPLWLSNNGIASQRREIGLAVGYFRRTLSLK